MDDQTKGRHVAVAVKVPDNKYEHPQVGINDADIVFVQRDAYVDRRGYDGTRLVPVFHSQLPESVGPVRSLRPVDVPALAPMRAVIGSSGGAPWVVKYIKGFSEFIDSEHTVVRFRKTGSYSIDRSRVYTANGKKQFDRALLCHPRILGEKSEAFPDGPPAPYFPWATGSDTPSVEAGDGALKVEAPWKGDEYAMVYDYDADGQQYLRSMPWGPHKMADGTRVTTENVLIIRGKWTREKLISGGGHAEPIHGLVQGSGTFIYAHGGKHVAGTWTKGKVEEPFKFRLDDGSPLFMSSGRTFVELLNLKSPVRVTA